MARVDDTARDRGGVRCRRRGPRQRIRRCPGAAQPPYPVILVHGLASDAGTWTAVRQALVAQGWEFGGFPTFVPATLGVTNVSPGALLR